MIAALVAVAAVVLIPAAARVAQAEQRRDLLAAEQAAVQELVRSQDKLIEAVQNDPVLVGRLARQELNLFPSNQYVMMDGARIPPPAIAITPTVTQKVAPPPAWLLRAGDKLSRPPVRRGLLLLSLAGLAFAFLTVPGRKAAAEGQS